MSPRPKLVVYDIATADGRVALSPDVLLMDDQRWPRYVDGGYPEAMRRHQPQVFLEGSGTLVLPEAGPLGPGIAPGYVEGDLPAGHFLPGDVMARARVAPVRPC